MINIDVNCLLFWESACSGLEILGGETQAACWGGNQKWCGRRGGSLGFL